MASRELERPLLGHAKVINPRVLSAGSIFANTIVIAIAYLVIKDNPTCDQPLILLTDWIIAVSLIGVIADLLKIVLGKNMLSSTMQGLGGVVFLGVWAWGHWPVYESEACDGSLWYFAFIVTLLGDIGVALGILIVCCLLICGGTAALLSKH